MKVFHRTSSHPRNLSACSQAHLETPAWRISSWYSAANNANVRRQTPTCARRSWATQTRFLDSSMEMNPSISLIAYSEEDARYRSHWVKSPFMKGITAIALGDSQGTQALFYFLSFLFELSAVQNAPKCRLLNKSKKQERQRLGSCSTEPALPVETLLLEDLPRVPPLCAPPRNCPYQCSQSKHSPTARPSRFRSCVAP